MNNKTDTTSYSIKLNAAQKAALDSIVKTYNLNVTTIFRLLLIHAATCESFKDLVNQYQNSKFYGV